MAGPSRLTISTLGTLRRPATLALARSSGSSISLPKLPPTSITPSRRQLITFTAHTRSTNRSTPVNRSPFSSTSTTISGQSNGNGDGEAGAVDVKPMTIEEYDRISERDMDILYDRLEQLCEVYAPEDWEVEYSSGVMNLTAPPTGTYVINKQPPNLQIWLSSPLSGPMRFGYSPDGNWVHHRKSDVTLGKILEDELRGLLKDVGGEEGWEGPGLE